MIQNFLLHLFFKFLLIILFLLLGVAYYTLCDRKVMAAMQRRSGPNVIGFWGLLQPLADGLKLFFKEFIVPNKSNNILFIIAPCISFSLSLPSWIVIPSAYNLTLLNIDYSYSYILTVSSLGVYGIILAGWSSNSQYAFLGCLRSVAQVISYEISLSLISLPLLLYTGSFNLIDIINIQIKHSWFIFSFFPLFLMFLISALAETNRIPFDLPEAEAELVAGYNIEYSGFGFALPFLAEYSNMSLMITLIIILFPGGWDCFAQNIYICAFFYFLKFFFLVFFLSWIRATLPRYRYDQLMKLGWKVFLCLTFAFSIFHLICLIFKECSLMVK